ncbi:LLM class flavin-dependent oxidoreductase [Actinokineospora auranticolor]|uniref:Luciferase family oxidoreductase group 1 n=1 Tax=Actinokineospora auranticolor TaxID=155976 RepID=A0A2S6GMK2_9PSEU|nr:LLM class flavin-dependent oxidoreductase [Actinokineospora auranticolor]PPK66455.1 luciferase family oxidoreductase group 1 [Actinokineospora auranticolor]
MPTPLSILDLAPVVSGRTNRDAIRATLDLARAAERFGYHRYWVAEHHFAPGVAAASPAVLAALIAGATDRIRVGSGAVLLGYYSPLSVAEQFGTIALAHPDRVDLGLGRSGLVRAADIAARFDRASGPVEPGRVVDGLLIPGKPKSALSEPDVIARLDTQQRLVGVHEGAGEYVDQVRQILDYLGDGYSDPDGRHYRAPAAEGSGARVWVLGSSAGASARAAGELGLPFTANYHVSPTSVLEAVEGYRAAFKPSADLAEPYVMVSADVVVAEDAATAQELASPYARWVLSIRSGAGAIPFPSVAEAAAFEWTDEQRSLVVDRVETQFVGTPGDVAERLDTLRRVTGADELMVTTITHGHEDRVRSFELLAKEWAG